MIGKILSAIFGVIIYLINLLLAPLDLIIDNALPSLSNALTSINSLFDYIISVIGFAINASGLSDISLALIVAYYTFVIGGTFSASVVKLALRWYNALKPQEVIYGKVFSNFSNYRNNYCYV